MSGAPPLSAAGTVGVHASLTSDYRFRGVSQSDGGPALQAGLDYQHGRGVFGGVWASAVSFDGEAALASPREVELDYYLGIEHGVANDWRLAASLVHYSYPGSSFDYNYTELLGGLRFRDRAGLSLAYADEFMGLAASARDYELHAMHPLAAGLEVSGAAGYYEIGGAIDRGYGYWNLGLSNRADWLSIDLRYHAVGGDAREVFGQDATRDALVLSLNAIY